MPQRIADHILYGDNRFLLRYYHSRRRNYVRLGKHWVFNAAAECVLHQQLLQLKVVLRDDQILLVGGHGALRTHHLNGRRRADLRLPFGIFQRLLGIGQRFLLHANILVSVDKIPVHVLDLVYGRDDLQAKRDIGNLAVVLGDSDESRIGKKSKTLQQVLRKAKLEGRTELRSEQARWIVGSEMSVVESARECATPIESLGITEIRCVSVLRYDRNRAENANRFRIVLVELQRASELRIEAGDGRADTQGRTDQTVRAGARAAGGDGGAPCAGTDGSAESANSATGCVLHDAGVHAENAGSGLGSEKIGFRNVQVVAGNIEIEIVLKREGDRVVDRKINLAVAHERIDPGRVAQSGLRQLLRHVRVQHVRKSRAGLGVILKMDSLRLFRLRCSRRCCLRRWRRCGRLCPERSRGRSDKQYRGQAERRKPGRRDQTL